MRLYSHHQDALLIPYSWRPACV